MKILNGAPKIFMHPKEGLRKFLSFKTNKKRGGGGGGAPKKIEPLARRGGGGEGGC